MLAGDRQTCWNASVSCSLNVEDLRRFVVWDKEIRATIYLGFEKAMYFEYWVIMI